MPRIGNTVWNSPVSQYPTPGIRPDHALTMTRMATAIGATLAVLAIAIVNLMHFSQGWVQFGYRFSNDFVPWAVILVALGAEAVARRGAGAVLVGGLVAVSILINAWGVAWGNLLGW